MRLMAVPNIATKLRILMLLRGFVVEVAIRGCTPLLVTVVHDAAITVCILMKYHGFVVEVASKGCTPMLPTGMLKIAGCAVSCCISAS